MSDLTSIESGARTSAGSADPSAVEVTPVSAAPRASFGDAGEQMMLGGMQQTLSGACPDCGSQLEYAEGCAKCHVCGFSECS